MTGTNVFLVLIGVGCLWVVTSPKIPTGIFHTAGLVLIFCGCIGGLDTTAWTDRAFTVRATGALLIFWGLLWRFYLRERWLDFSTRWKVAHDTAKFFGMERRTHRRKTD